MPRVHWRPQRAGLWLTGLVAASLVLSACTGTPIAATPAPTSAPAASSTPTDTPTKIPVVPTKIPTNTPRPPQVISVKNAGGFVARFSVAYDLPGAPGQNQAIESFPIGVTKNLSVPGNALNVTVTVEEFTGFSWNTACTRVYPQAISVNIEVSGTTFGPSCNGG